VKYLSLFDKDEGEVVIVVGLVSSVGLPPTTTAEGLACSLVVVGS
jgi:hypothetical protein